MTKVKLLILSCGTNACWHVVKLLKEKFPNEFYLIGVDVNERALVPGATLLDSFFTVPYSNSSDFLPVIEDIIRRERPHWILPSFDYDQQLFSEDSEMLRRYSVVSFAAPKETLLAYSDKAKMHLSMSDCGLPVPINYNLPALDNCERYIVKPINGVGSVGVFCEEGAILKNRDIGNDVIIQERCFGPEVTMECFSHNGLFSAICRERILTKAGVCVKARVFKSPKLESIARRFIKHFKVPMVFNLQFMKNHIGEYVITDVNLRLAGGMGLSYAAGWDVVSAMAKVILGRPDNEVMTTLPIYIQEQYAVSISTPVITDVYDKVVAFDLDGTLVDSRKRHEIVLQDVLNEEFFEIQAAGLVDFKRNGYSNRDYLLEKGCSKAQADRIQRKWISRIENEVYLAQDILYSDTVKLIKEYEGWRRVLITARKNKDGLYKQLDLLGIRDMFDAIHVVDPSCDVAMVKAEKLREERALLYYGDTKLDYKAAGMADVHFKYRGDGFHSYETVVKG